MVTANLRAARMLVADFAEDQLASGATAWPTPRIVDWNSWVAELWQQYARSIEAGPLAGNTAGNMAAGQRSIRASRAGREQPGSAPLPLTILQEHQLWKQVLGEDRYRVVAADRMAELAQQAYGLLGKYHAHRLRQDASAGIASEIHEDAERFLAWAAAFDRLCEQHGWLSRTRLEETLAAGTGWLEAIAELYLVGFDRTTPAQALLLTALADRGTVVGRYTEGQSELRESAPGQQGAGAETEAETEVETGEGTITGTGMGASGPPVNELVSFQDQRQELEACAWWCRHQLARPRGDGQAAPRIAVITPDLRRVRAGLDRVFRGILMPETTLWPTAENLFPSPFAPGEQAVSPPPDPPLPYEFSLGDSLARVPVVRAALLVLRWLQSPLATAEVTWLLTSGFLAASQADLSALARLDVQLRRNSTSRPEIGLNWLLRRENSRHLPDALRTRLTRLLGRATQDGLGQRTDRDSAGRATEAPVRRQSYAHWAELVPALLADSSWPGYRPADSYAYQAQQRWLRLLGEVAELGFDGTQPSWLEFLQTLDAQAHAVIYAAESGSPPIQILGAFESSGQSFDAVWFLGADDQHWPSVGRPHPLLPAWLQREAGMPHASPEIDWLLAQEATARIVASAPVVVLSYSTQEKAVALRASPLVLAATNTANNAAHSPGRRETDAATLLAPAGLLHPADVSHRLAPAGPSGLAGLVSPEVAALPGRWPQSTAPLAPAALEWVADDSGALPWPVQQSAGGAEVLKQQAACAFQSLATRRLQARVLEDAEAGLNARDRGTLLHEVLARLWSAQPGDPMRLHDRDDLLRAIEEGSLARLVSHQIEAQFALLAEKAKVKAGAGASGGRIEKASIEAAREAGPPGAFYNDSQADQLDQSRQADQARQADQDQVEQVDSWDRAYLACEKQRVLERLLAWLDCERERQPFTVAAVESGVQNIDVGSLRLNVRPDRVDRLADGSHLLIDYKTGKVRTSAWDGLRPEEPQLPLYAIYGGVERVSSVAFAQIRADGTKLMARAEDAARQVSATLGKFSASNRFDDEVRDLWQEALQALAGQFLRGDARVNPRNGLATCQHCALGGLCRVQSTGASLDDDEPDEGNARD